MAMAAFFDSGLWPKSGPWLLCGAFQTFALISPTAASGPHLPFKLTCDAAARPAEAAVHAVCSILRY